ncbi:unnamed protein product [Arctogadus glacialis]
MGGGLLSHGRGAALKTGRLGLLEHPDYTEDDGVYRTRGKVTSEFTIVRYVCLEDSDWCMAAVHLPAPDPDLGPKDPRGVTRDRHRLINSQPNPSLAQQPVVGGAQGPVSSQLAICPRLVYLRASMSLSGNRRQHQASK